MSTPGTEQGERRNAPTLELLRSLAADVKALVLCETELATQEFKEKASEARSGAAMLGAGLLIAFVSVLTLTAAAVLGAGARGARVGRGRDRRRVPPCLAAIVFVLLARARFRIAMPLAPTQTIGALRRRTSSGSEHGPTS